MVGSVMMHHIMIKEMAVLALKGSLNVLIY